MNLVLTDPPYGIDIVNSGSALKGQVGASKLAKCNNYYPVIGDESIETAKDSYKIFKKLSDKLIIWGGNYFVDFLENSSSWIIWDKREGMASNNFADGEMAWCSFSTPVRIFHQLWSGMIRAGEHEKRVHPTQKPIRMLSEVITRFTDPGDVILDVFGGSGSTLMACEQVHRRCLMMELDPHYCSVIIDRWETYTGSKAQKVSG